MLLTIMDPINDELVVSLMFTGTITSKSIQETLDKFRESLIPLKNEFIFLTFINEYTWFKLSYYSKVYSTFMIIFLF